MRGPVLMLVLAALVGALVAVPVAVYAAHSFKDVPSSNTFHADIAWLVESGVTRGCNPPANDEFCPGDVVTREQMAAFMRRFAQYLGAEDGTPAEADHAATAGLADTVKDGAVTNAKLADDAIAARALGTVSYAGTMSLGAINRNLTNENVSKPETGVYCISGLGFTPSTVVVTGIWGFNAPRTDPHVFRMSGGPPCPSNTQIEVHTYLPGTNTLTDSNFTIVIYG